MVFVAATAAAPSACCMGSYAPPPGLSSHPPPAKRHPTKPRHVYKPPGGSAIEGKSVPVEGVPGGRAIVINSPSPTPTAAPSSSPAGEAPKSP